MSRTLRRASTHARRARRGESVEAQRSRPVVRTGWELLGGKWPHSIETVLHSERIAWKVLRSAVAVLVDAYDGKPTSGRVKIATAYWEARGWILNDEWPCGLSFLNACRVLKLEGLDLRRDLAATGVLGVVQFKSYFEWIKVFGFCCVCNSRPECCVDFDHRPTRGAKGRLHHDRGIPSCRKHHSEAHAIGIESFQRKYAIDVREQEKKWRAKYERWLAHNGFDTTKAKPEHSVADTSRVPWKRRTGK